MEVSNQRLVRAIAALLVIAAITQTVYTALYIAKLDVPRQLLWGSEGLLFPLLAALAGTAMVRSKTLTLAFAAIAFGAVLNLVQVGVGLTLFFPFSDAAKAVPALAPVAGAIVAFAFFIYNAAKLLLGFAAVIVGLFCIARGGKLIGGATAVVGAVAMVANGLSIVGGQGVLGDLPLAGGSGVLATLLLAVSLFALPADER